MSAGVRTVCPKDIQRSYSPPTISTSAAMDRSRSAPSHIEYLARDVATCILERKAELTKKAESPSNIASLTIAVTTLVQQFQNVEKKVPGVSIGTQTDRVVVVGEESMNAVSQLALKVLDRNYIPSESQEGRGARH